MKERKAVMEDNIIRELSEMGDKELKHRCIGGLIAYAAQCERDNPSSAWVPEIRELVGRIAFYWGLDGLSEETLQKDFLQPFDMMTGAVKAGAELPDAFYNQRIAAVYGLTKYCCDLADSHGSEAMGEIHSIYNLTMEIAVAWQLDAQDFGPLGLDAAIHTGGGGQHQEQNSDPLPASRKAELFDELMHTTREHDPGDNWYDMLHEIGMDEDEMRAAGLDLPELKVTPEAVEAMVDYLISEIKKTHMEGHQLRIEFSLNELVARFGFDPRSCALAREMFEEEVAAREEITSAGIIDGKLLVKPENSIIDQLHELEPPGLTMQ